MKGKLYFFLQKTESVIFAKVVILYDFCEFLSKIFFLIYSVLSGCLVCLLVAFVSASCLMLVVGCRLSSADAVHMLILGCHALSVVGVGS